MKTKFIIFIFAIFVYSCIRTLPDEELTKTRTFYNGKEIRLNGYYAGFQPGHKEYSDYIFFYSNGIILSFGYSNGVNDFNQIPNVINVARARKDCWGIFQVINDTIAIQGWSLRADVYQNLLINYQYRIINDTTLFYKNSSGNTTMYYFKKFSPKPDSTNVFIK